MVSTEGMIARELRNAADRYLDLNDLCLHIEKIEKLDKDQPSAEKEKPDRSILVSDPRV